MFEDMDPRMFDVSTLHMYNNPIKAIHQQYTCHGSRLEVLRPPYAAAIDARLKNGSKRSMRAQRNEILSESP